MPIEIKDFLSKKAEDLMASGTPGRLIVYGLSRHMDNFISDIYGKVLEKTNSAHGSSMVIVGVGGYGRSELYPFSDVDILILSRDGSRESKDLAQGVLYALWDNGLDLSHSFRTIKECADDSMKDITMRTSLLESRFIAGDRGLYDEYMRDVYQKVLFKNKKGFVVDILREIEKRHKQFGESIFLLEPNIKEGKGALRDIHAISWLLKVVQKISGIDDYGKILSGKDLAVFVKAYDFMVKLRIALHCVSGRKNEILSFDLQDDVARRFRFRRTSRAYSPEIMMRLYYSRAKIISYFLQQVKDVCSRQFFSFPGLFGMRRITGDFYLYKNEIVVKNKDVLRDPDRLIEAFYVFSTTRNRFSQQAKDLIRVSARRIPRKRPLSTMTKDLFFKILSGRRVFETLREMHDTAVLERVIPEFSRLRHLVIYEPAHRYTVDKHSLVAIRHLEDLKSSEDDRTVLLRDLLASSKQQVLFFAILLHDIGKGVSRDHSEEGYHLIKGILERFGLDHREVKTIEFLVKNHVVLAKLALSRDTDAPETILQLAEMVGDEQTLNVLYLMTYADMKALNPGYLSEWKAFFLYDLYMKTRNHLRGARRGIEDFSDARIKEFLQDMPERYLISSTTESMERDWRLTRQLDVVTVAFDVRENKDGSAELTVVTHDRPQLFSAIVSTLGLRSLDILRARLFTGRSGLVVDRILISNWGNLWWDGLAEEIRYALTERIGAFYVTSESEQTAGDYQGLYDYSAPPIRFKRLVEVDNEDSEESTILEMLLPDRPGLLQQITQALSSLEIDILAAVINTEDSIAHNVFYIQKDAAKIDDSLMLSLISLLYAARSVRVQALWPAQ